MRKNPTMRGQISQEVIVEEGIERELHETVFIFSRSQKRKTAVAGNKRIPSNFIHFIDLHHVVFARTVPSSGDQTAAIRFHFQSSLYIISVIVLVVVLVSS
jgi:hypothetical protein